MRRQDFNRLIDSASFSELFIGEMGWNNPFNNQPLLIEIDNVTYEFVPVADKCGFQVYSCNLEAIPSASDYKKIDNKLRNFGYDYICIFVLNGSGHHLWLTPVKTNEKRELVKTEYEGGVKADFLFSKISDLTFSLTEVVYISDVKRKVQGSFHLNSEKVTKDFYAQFKKEHKAFTKHISGIENEKDRDWYSSVMLNRLMFCYFIQKKGFLDRKVNYLQDKLKWVQEQRGENQFFKSFYQDFLCVLFHDGLNSPRHSDDFIQVYGRIPYLNGGMFDEHQLERENCGIDIEDEAFKNLFDFFDKWNWHLDTRLTASGKDINPDVLGYIFEQYINDRAAMGAYYTKEDITEYIGKNCIIPFLMDKTASATKDSAKDFEQNGFVWSWLRESGDKYIYDAVKKGYSKDWESRIPDYISKGIDTSKGGLLERRARWNEKTHEDFALPTEIWRETVERLQRCDSLLQKICNGEIHSINDFITYNLDIRQFCEDVIRHTTNHKFVAHFYHALQNVTVLDPTCGSGAFLFAALNILEPLYEACLDRMEEFNSDNNNLFVNELEEVKVKYSSNRQYFIHKSIILRNLYGVDIMVEATEIAKLRLFLKMVAVVDVDVRKDNLGLDPLPDIDFNIKCGNTLVGYATEFDLFNQNTIDEQNSNDAFRNVIEMEMNLVATAYQCFRSEQLKTYDDNASIKATKEMLKERLKKLNSLLNKHLHESVSPESDYDKWLQNTQPFHWLAEYYHIVKGNGGFDVIIGNPPYVVYNPKVGYSITGYESYECKNLYGYVLERSYKLLHADAKFGFIIPISSVASPDYAYHQQIYKNNSCWISNYAATSDPGILFVGVKLQLSIVIVAKDNIVGNTYTTNYKKWYIEERKELFNCLYFAKHVELKPYSVSKNQNGELERALLKKYNEEGVSSFVSSKNSIIYYKTYGNYFWKQFLDYIPFFDDGEKSRSGSVAEIVVPESMRYELLAVYNSTTFYYIYMISSDCRNMKRSCIEFFRYRSIDDNVAELLKRKGKELAIEVKKNSIIREERLKSGIVRKNEIFKNWNKSKHIIDEIDKILAKHYGFTEEELDFIINYDIKYRMGDELGNEDE